MFLLHPDYEFVSSRLTPYYFQTSIPGIVFTSIYYSNLATVLKYFNYVHKKRDPCPLFSFFMSGRLLTPSNKKCLA